MSEQEKKNDKESMICLMPKAKPKFLCLPYRKQRKFFTGKELFKEKGKWRTEPKAKRRLFNCSHYDD